MEGCVAAIWRRENNRNFLVKFFILFKEQIKGKGKDVLAIFYAVPCDFYY